ncbi:acetyltransferase [Salmonella enterica subsp. enterica]|nr:acetyltransferase [Salmonella enterica subsp. enterica]
MLIRVEIPIDAPGIDALLRRSFESDAEAKLVHDLREDGFLTLGLVATDDEGQVVGYVAFSPVDVQGEDLQWVGMAPLAVDEKYRGQGLARQLVYEGLDSLNEFGYAAVVTLGDPALYSRFGFELAAHYDLHCRWPGTESAFQVHRLAEDALEGVTGLVEYHDHFNRFKHRRLQAGQQRLKRFAFRHKALLLALCELFDAILYAQGQRAIADLRRKRQR